MNGAKQAGVIEGLGMNEEIRSIFDLSPSEKLQLVEDLWDDLAACPEVIPVHDWQKEELDRRKANLQQKLASAISWQDVQPRIRRQYAIPATPNNGDSASLDSKAEPLV
jgi:putative addiction module component (TIGR02574 family)